MWSEGVYWLNTLNEEGGAVWSDEGYCYSRMMDTGVLCCIQPYRAAGNSAEERKAAQAVVIIRLIFRVGQNRIYAPYSAVHW